MKVFSKFQIGQYIFFVILSWGIKFFIFLENSNQHYYLALKMNSQKIGLRNQYSHVYFLILVFIYIEKC